MYLQKTARTDKRIYDTYYGLLRRKDAADITVTAICAAADINRSTFYKRYPTMDDFRRAAVDELYGRLIREATSDISDFSQEHIADKITRRILAGIKDNIAIFRNLYTTNASLIDLSSNSQADFYLRERATENTKKTELDLVFFKYGVGGIITEWIRTGCEQPIEEIAAYLTGLLHRIFDASW